MARCNACDSCLIKGEECPNMAKLGGKTCNEVVAYSDRKRRKNFKSVDRDEIPAYHRTTVDELREDLDALANCDQEIFIHTADTLDMVILSVYGNKNGIHIDVGPAITEGETDTDDLLDI